MSWFDIGGNDAKKAPGSTVSGYGGNPYLTSQSALSSFFAGSGQTKDETTGIVGRSKQEVYDKAVAGGMSASGLSDLAKRLRDM